ncbi:hypothetical protein LJB99_00130 [Deltaproteobacteria bacterium OttesenSCG-928-K17]|nr:hypothetical protein [Deltaproteobacteria bacterium OttesenSCG-928-K17]
MTVSRSELGTKAAWKGFASQTVYIAHRLLNATGKYNYYPENIEDLKITDHIGNILELVQVKNLKKGLSLSDISPKQEDSFFKRSLQYKTGNPQMTLRLVSFGEVGPEMMGLINNEQKSVDQITQKLMGIGYQTEDIAWLVSHLVIEQVKEDDLEHDLLTLLKARIETMASPGSAKDLLTSYISHISRHGISTSKQLWDDRISDLAKDLASISGLCNQYGKTVQTLDDYQSNLSKDRLAQEYKRGAITHPEHIRLNLDFVRDKWCTDLAESFNSDGNNIVIIKAASGQGKSSLAYRYLLDNYPEKFVFVISLPVDRQQAHDIVAALSGLSVNRPNEIIIYMDVPPYNLEWSIIAKAISDRGLRLNLLITIREEDFNRTSINLDEVNASIINLYLDFDEAKEIFTRSRQSAFLNFDDAWQSFGEQGPFMEFAYLLEQGDTLKNKLNSQVSQIVHMEEDADSWLKTLLVVSYAGQYALPVDMQSLVSIIAPGQYLKMLGHFENEYFIRKVSDNSVEILHPVRGEILYKILREKLLLPESDTLIMTVNAMRCPFDIILIAFFYKTKEASNKLVAQLLEIRSRFWFFYISVLRALLWLDCYMFYTKNEDTFDQGDSLLGTGFITGFIGDITGQIQVDFVDKFLKMFQEANPAYYQRIIELRELVNPKIIGYDFTDQFISNYADIDLSSLNFDTSNESLSSLGFILFWFAQRGKYLDLGDFPKITSNLSGFSLDSISDFILGLENQRQYELCEALRTVVLPRLCTAEQITYLDSNTHTIQAKFIIDLLSEQTKISSKNGSNFIYDQVIYLVTILRKIFYSKNCYHVSAIGVNIKPGIVIPDTEKNIEDKDLPLHWFISLNSWVNKFSFYKLRPSSWALYVNSLHARFQMIYEYLDKFTAGLERYSRKGKTDIFFSEGFFTFDSKLKNILHRQTMLPKSAEDKYGLGYVKNQNESQNVGRDYKPFKSYKKSDGEIINSLINVIERSMTNFREISMPVLLSMRGGITIGGDSHQLSQCQYNLFDAAKSFLQLANTEYYHPIEQLNSIFNKDVYEKILLLIFMWRELPECKPAITKNQSLIYKSRETIKQLRKKTKCCLEDIFSKYLNIIEIKGRRLVARIDNLRVRDFCDEMFIEVKKLIPGNSLSLECLIAIEGFEEICLLPLTHNTTAPGGLLISMDSLFNQEDIDAFWDSCQSIDLNQMYKNEVDLFDYSNTYILKLRYTAQINDFSTMCLHISDVETHLADYKTSEYFCDTGYNRWQTNIKKACKNIFDEFLRCLNHMEGFKISDPYGIKQKLTSRIIELLSMSADELITTMGRSQLAVEKVEEALFSVTDEFRDYDNEADAMLNLSLIYSLMIWDETVL